MTIMLPDHFEIDKYVVAKLTTGYSTYHTQQVIKNATSAILNAAYNTYDTINRRPDDSPYAKMPIIVPETRLQHDLRWKKDNITLFEAESNSLLYAQFGIDLIPAGQFEELGIIRRDYWFNGKKDITIDECIDSALQALIIKE